MLMELKRKKQSCSFLHFLLVKNAKNCIGEDFTLCVTNVLLRENAREQISHLYFFKFFDLLVFVVEWVFVVSPFDVVGRRIKSINVADDGTRTLLFVIVYWW
jgi:hypothetical protein